LSALGASSRADDGLGPNARTCRSYRIAFCALDAGRATFDTA